MSPLALSLHFLLAQPDSRLVALAREGHEPAFEALVRRYRKELLGYCRRLQPRSGSAEDALQQTLLQAWTALRAGAEVREVRPWLYRIAHNVSLNHLRVAVAVPQEVPEEAGGQELHQLVEQRLRARAALAGMASLPALQRDVFVSTTLNGVSHDEVASTLGLSSGAVRGLVYRARATLRSAAAALTPSFVLQWAMRRAELRPAGARAVSEALAGGGGAGVAAAIAKGGAVLSLAGAVAGAGSAVLTDASSHHRREARVAGSSAGSQTRRAPLDAADAELAMASAVRGTASWSHSANRLGLPVRRAAGEQHRDSGSVGEDQRGSSGGSATDHSDRSQGGSDGRAPTTTSSDGSSGSSRGGSSGGADGGSSGGPSGGSSGSSGSSTLTTSGSDGGISGGGPGPSSSTQLTAAQMTSDGGSGSDGGATSSSPSSSGSGDTTTTNSH